MPPPEPLDVFESPAAPARGPVARVRRGMRWLFATSGEPLDEPPQADEELPVAPVRPWLTQQTEPAPEPPPEPEPEVELQPEPEVQPEPEPESAAETAPDAEPRPGADLARRLAEANSNAMSNTLMGSSATVPAEVPVETPQPTARKRADAPQPPPPAKRAPDKAVPDKAPVQKPPSKGESGGHAWRRFAIVLVIAVAAAVGLRAYVIAPYFIPSASMEQTLHGCPGCNNDHVLVNKLSYRLHAVRRGDVVVFHRPSTWHVGEKLLIKRVIGLPGDVLTTRNGTVYVNGQQLEEPYLDRTCADPTTGLVSTTGLQRIQVPAGAVFVMGDNRCDSDDSRVWGTVPTSAIVGRAFIVVWPFNRLRWL